MAAIKPGISAYKVTFNAIGLRTPLPAGDRTEPRCAQVVRFLRTTNTSVMGIQEHHLSTPEAVADLVTWFKIRNYGFLVSTLGKGNGGASIVFPLTWRVLKELKLSPRMLYVELEHPDGYALGFFVGHFHHEAEMRKGQWDLRP